MPIVLVVYVVVWYILWKKNTHTQLVVYTFQFLFAVLVIIMLVTIMGFFASFTANLYITMIHLYCPSVRYTVL